MAPAASACTCRGSTAGFSGRVVASPGARARAASTRQRQTAVASAASQSGGSRATAARKDASSVSTSALPAVAASLALPFTEASAPETTDELPGRGLGAIFSAKKVSTARELGIDVSQVCKDGFCGFKETDGSAGAATDDSELSDARPTLAGLTVSTLNVAALRPNVVPMTPDSDGAGIHPDAERRLRAREARKARRRSSVVQMAEKEWWKSAVSNVVEASSEEQYQAALADAAKEGKCVVVDFYAPWCQACRRQFPDLLRFAVARPDVLFVKVNASNLRPMCEGLGVERLPSYGVHVPGSDSWMTGFLSNLTSKLQAAHSPARINV